MDIILLRQTLRELNPFFWNAAINSQLKDSEFPNRSPVESALFRYTTVTLRNEKGKNRIKDLFKEVEKCLSPYDRVFDVLRKEFTSSFAEQVLLSNEKLIKDFAGVSTDNFWPWMSFVVCMSHKDFWADLASKQKKDAEKPPETDFQQSNSVDEFIRQHTSSDPHKLPADFKKILAEEINLLHLPVPTPRRPFAVDSDYIQTGMHTGDYILGDLDRAILRFVFDVAEPVKLEKAALKDWMLNKCGVSLSELKELSWPDISRRLLSALASTRQKEAEEPAEIEKKTTWGEIKRWAAKEADEVSQAIRSKPLKFCQYVAEAFYIAALYARVSRVSPEKRNMDSGQFLSTYLRLVENLKRADKLLQTSPNLLDKWPQAPNTTFGSDAGLSALAVAYKFSQRVETAVTIARAFTLGVGHGENFFDAIVPSDERVRDWLDAAVKELQTKALPPVADWPMWQIHRDGDSLRYQLLAEQKEAEKPAEAEQKTDLPKKLEADIPAAHRSPPLSLTRMAECWGGDMTPKKLRNMIKSGSLRVIKLNRQTYVFDTKYLPDEVITKVKR